MGRRRDKAEAIKMDMITREAERVDTMANDMVSEKVQASGEDQMSPEMKVILEEQRATAKREALTSMGSGVNMKSGCQLKKHMK